MGQLIIRSVFVSCISSIRKRIGFVNNLTIKHCDKTKVKTITVKNSKRKRYSAEYKCTKQILRDLYKTLLSARNICTQCHVNSLARTESLWVFSPGFSSLINNISNIKETNFALHFLKIENCLSFKSDFDRPWSSKCLPIAECLCSPMRWWCKCRVVYPT